MLTRQLLARELLVRELFPWIKHSSWVQKEVLLLPISSAALESLLLEELWNVLVNDGLNPAHSTDSNGSTVRLTNS